MNPKEDNEENQSHGQTRVEVRQETNDNRSTQQEPKPCPVAKLQNRLSNEQFKLNNNVGEGDNGCTTSSRATNTFSSAPPAVQTNATAIYSNSSTVNTDPDSLKTNIVSTYSNSQCPKVQATNTNTPGLFKVKTSAYTNSSSTNSNTPPTYSNTPPAYSNTSASYSNATPSYGITTYSNTPSYMHASAFSNVSAISNEDTDMRNNVDYVSGIEKCPSKVSCSSDSSPEADPMWASSSYTPKCTLNNIGSSIGSTSQGTCCFLRPNINGSREAAGPSGLQRVSQREHDRRDSSSGNEGDMSDVEDCCIYTYKGRDDPSNEDLRLQVGHGQLQGVERDAEALHHSGSSSPEMDFLEMDFDPGPSCEQDTGDSDMASINEDIQNIALDSVETDPAPLNDLSSGRVPSRQGNPPTSQQTNQNPDNLGYMSNQSYDEPQCSTYQKPSHAVSSPWMPSTSSGVAFDSSKQGTTVATEGLRCEHISASQANPLLARWTVTGLHRSTGCPLQESYGHHNTNGDLISPGDSRDSDAELWADSATGSIPENSSLDSRKVNLSSTLYHRMMAKKLMLNKQAAFNQSGDSNLESELCNERLEGLLPVEKVMLWNEHEATVKQVTQIGTSACGATSAINALLALDVAFSLEVLVRGVATRLREPGTPLPRYLMSRSRAGATHTDLARGMSLATSGAVVTKFFAFYPERKISLSHWLHYWISKGAVPIATLNLQHCGEGHDIPDAWHHQMIFGVGPAGIYLTNPLQCLPEQVVWHQLVSPSILLIRRADVLAHWNSATDLTPLMLLDQRWRKLNVLGQVVNLVRETMGQKPQSAGISSSATHIRIPASYKAGITLVMHADAPAAAELLHIEQLPLL